MGDSPPGVPLKVRAPGGKQAQAVGECGVHGRGGCSGEMHGDVIGNGAEGYSRRGQCTRSCEGMKGGRSVTRRNPSAGQLLQRTNMAYAVRTDMAGAHVQPSVGRAHRLSPGIHQKDAVHLAGYADALHRTAAAVTVRRGTNQVHGDGENRFRALNVGPRYVVREAGFMGNGSGEQGFTAPGVDNDQGDRGCADVQTNHGLHFLILKGVFIVSPTVLTAPGREQNSRFSAYLALKTAFYSFSRSKQAL